MTTRIITPLEHLVIYHTDTGGNRAVLVRWVLSDPDCKETEDVVREHFASMAREGFLQIKDEWVRVTEKGWQLWATRPR